MHGNPVTWLWRVAERDTTLPHWRFVVRFMVYLAVALPVGGAAGMIIRLLHGLS